MADCYSGHHLLISRAPLITRFYSRLKPVLMDRPRFAFRSLKKNLFVFGLFCFLSLFNDDFWFPITFLLMGMSAAMMLKSDNDPELATPVTDRSDAREKGRRLKEAVVANRLYEHAELTLTTLAVKLMIHPHDLSRLINVGLEKSFSDFINEFRVREVVRKMHDPSCDKFTLLGIAYESGFYPDIAIAIDSAYIDNPDTLVKKAQINIDKQQAMSEAALEAQQAAEQSKQANDKLKKLKSKRPVTRKRDQ